jgi:hypothetical protein
MAFRDLGPKRTISGAAQALKDEALRDPTKKSSGRGNNWSRVHNWVARARAWDNHMQSARDDVKRSYEKKWEQRRLDAVEEAWETGVALHEKATQMLAMPLVERRIEKDGKTTILKPSKWSFQTVSDMLRLAADLKASASAAATKPLDQCDEVELAAIEEANLAGKALQADGKRGADREDR